MKESTPKKEIPPLTTKDRVIFSLLALIFILYGILTWTHTDLFKDHWLDGFWNRVFGTVAAGFGILSGLAASTVGDPKSRDRNKTSDIPVEKVPSISEIEFTPENKLEWELLKTKQGDGMPYVDLLKFVLNQTVVVLAKTITMNEDPDKAPRFHDPMPLYGENDEPQIAAYTSMSRAKEKQKSRTEYGYLVELKVGDLLSSITKGAGIAINANLKVGLQLYSIHVTQLKALLSKITVPDGTEEFVFDELFKPENELESTLKKCQIENTPLGNVLEMVVNQTVYVLTEEPEAKQPMVIVFEGETENNLAAYSSLSRAKNKQEEDPKYKYIEERRIGDLLQWNPEDMGFIINPGLKVGLIMNADHVREVKPLIKSD